MNINITSHGLWRVKQRLKVSKEYAYKIVFKAYKNGIHQRDVRNKSIRKYLESTVQDGYFGVLYCEYLFIFSKDSNSLITVLRIPDVYIDILNNDKNNKRRKNNNAQRKCKKNKRITGEKL